MKTIFRIATTFFLILLVALSHIASGYLLRYPFDTANIILAVSILLLIIQSSGTIVWMGFGCYFIIELFTITPFGVVLFAGTCAILLSFWLLRYVFTNQSVYAALGATIFAVLVYQAIYFLLLGIISFIRHTPLDVLIPAVRSLIWEILFTSILVAVLYLMWYLVSYRIFGKKLIRFI